MREIKQKTNKGKGAVSLSLSMLLLSPEFDSVNDFSFLFVCRSSHKLSCFSFVCHLKIFELFCLIF